MNDAIRPEAIETAAEDLYRALVSEHGHSSLGEAPWPSCLPVHIALNRYLDARKLAARVPVSPEGWKAAMDDPAFVAAVAEGRADLAAGRVKPFPVSPEGLDVEPTLDRHDMLSSTGEASNQIDCEPRRG